MAKNKKEFIQQADILSMFKSNFYDYGMSVIEDRAIPDIRDGLKPVHRAIIYEMLTANATSKHKLVKVAKIAGAVIGNWHPHGDGAVEDALTGLAVPWKNTLPTIEVAGNQGSVFGDPAAAGRYIETRLTPAGDAYGHKLRKGIVEYVPNFDNTADMPSILPAQLPYLLINGISDGIAVGVATSLPPHNAKEVIEMTLQYIKNPRTKLEDLLAIMPGPDFPTGATIINQDELYDMYSTGHGKISVRAKITYDKKAHTLHVVEIPYLYAGSMDKLLALLVKDTNEVVDARKRKTPPKILGVKSVDDYSGKDGIDIAIALHKDADHEIVLQNLYAKTRLETTVKFMFRALNEKKLSSYSLRQYLAEYTEFQHEIVTNEHILEKAALDRQIEILEGRLIAITVIDEIVDVVKHSDGRSSVMDVLMNGTILEGTNKKYHDKVSQFSFTKLQAEAISGIPLYQLNRLDSQKTQLERDKHRDRLLIVNRIIDDQPYRRKLIISRLQKEYKSLPDVERQTTIIQADPSRAADIEIPLVDMHVGLDRYGYIRIEDKPFEDSLTTDNRSRVGVFDSLGNCWNIHMDSTKPTKERGTLSSQMFDTTDRMVGMITPINETSDGQALFIYEDGSMKRTQLADFMTKSRATKVNTRHPDKPLHTVRMIEPGATTVTINKKRHILDDIPLHTRAGSGRIMLSGITHEPLDISFKAGPVPTKTKTVTQTPSDVFDAVVTFDGSDKCEFDWTTTDPSGFEGLYVTTYKELIQSTLVFVHSDGTAKRVSGKQFEVKTKRTSLQANKTGLDAIYIDKAYDQTLVGTYEDGASKRIDETKISNQSKVGGGVRVFHSPKHTLTGVTYDKDSNLPIVSFATQPK